MKIQIIINKILNLAPRNLALIPYDFANFVVSNLGYSKGLRCWSRNSYVFGNINPGLSDIDFTLVIPNKDFLNKANDFICDYATLKKIIPFLGEINFYDSSHFHQIAQWINYYELQRDPSLSELLPSRTPNPCEKPIFLLRMLESDLKNLRGNPELRKNKWDFHLKQCEIRAPNKLTLENLIREITETLPKALNPQESYEFIAYYLNHGIEETYLKYRRLKKIKLFILLYPHRWLVYANGIKDVEICLNSLIFNEDELNLILHQIRWEVFGIYCQDQLKKNPDVEKYITCLEQFILKIKCPEKDYFQDDLMNSFKFIKSICR